MWWMADWLFRDSVCDGCVICCFVSGPFVTGLTQILHREILVHFVCVKNDCNCSTSSPRELFYILHCRLLWFIDRHILPLFNFIGKDIVLLDFYFIFYQLILLINWSKRFCRSCEFIFSCIAPNPSQPYSRPSWINADSDPHCRSKSCGDVKNMKLEDLSFF